MEFDANGNQQKPQPSGTTAKPCARCGIQKPLGDYHKKGSRIDGSCKACISAKKKARYKKRHLQAKAPNACRSQSSVLVVNSLKIEETNVGNGIDRSHLESILQQFVFDSVSRKGVEDEES